MQLPLNLTLLASRRLAIMLLVAHAGAIAMLAAISAPLWIRALLFLLIAWSAWHSLQKIHGSLRIIRLILKADGRLEYLRLSGESGEATVHPNSTVMPQLTVLLLRLEKGSEPLIVLPDSLNAEDFRQLRLWLRWRAAATVNLQ